MGLQGLEEQARQRDRKPAQSYRSNPLAKLRDDRHVDPDDAERIPGEAGEKPAPRPFEHDPCGGEGENSKNGSVRRQPFAEGQGKRRKNAEIGGKKRHRQPPGPLRQVSLVMEGLCQPMKAQHGLTQAKGPPQNKQLASALNAIRRSHQRHEADDRDRPE